MANTLLTDQHITAEALMILENSLTFTKQVNRDFQKEFTQAHRGATIYVKKPPRYTVRDGQNVVIQDTTITQVPITLNHQFGVDVQFSSQDLTLNIDTFGRDVLQPQIVAIANAIDGAGLQLAATSTGNYTGTAGTTPGSVGTAQQVLTTFTKGAAILDKTGAPRDGQRAVILNEDAQAAVVPALSGLFQSGKTVAEQYDKGQMGTALGLKWGMDQNVAVFTTGPGGGSPQVNGVITPLTAPPGNTLGPIATFTIPSKGWTASTLVLLAGDVISINTCYGVNPVSYLNYGILKQFVVAANVTSDAGGLANITVTEPMILVGAYKNITTVPANNAAININTAPANTVSPQNIIFHKNAFTLACVNLPLPGGVHMAARKSDDQLGLSIRFVAAYNISTDQFIGRFDVLCGWAALRPEWAVRVAG